VARVLYQPQPIRRMPQRSPRNGLHARAVLLSPEPREIVTRVCKLRPQARGAGYFRYLSTGLIMGFLVGSALCAACPAWSLHASLTARARASDARHEATRAGQRALAGVEALVARNAAAAVPIRLAELAVKGTGAGVPCSAVAVVASVPRSPVAAAAARGADIVVASLSGAAVGAGRACPALGHALVRVANVGWAGIVRVGYARLAVAAVGARGAGRACIDARTGAARDALAVLPAGVLMAVACAAVAR
jgi:hypothetical protein